MRLDDRFRLLIWICLSEIGTMLVFSNYSALLPILQKEWFLTNSEAVWIYSSYQIGYILAVVFLTSLTDYTNPKYIYLVTSFWAGVAGILFSLWAEGASLSPIAFGYILDITNPSEALVQFGYVPNWGWAFMLLGIGGLIGPLAMLWIKKRVAD